MLPAETLLDKVMLDAELFGAVAGEKTDSLAQNISSNDKTRATWGAPHRLPRIIFVKSPFCYFPCLFSFIHFVLHFGIVPLKILIRLMALKI